MPSLRLAAGRHEPPVDPAFEHALLALEGATAVDGQDVACGALLVLEPGCDRVVLVAAGPARVFLLGGAPFEADLVMWWNFVARTHDEIAAARADWAAGAARFGVVPGGEPPLPAPAMPSVRLKARGRTGSRRDG
ncbi:hypothetical protein GCM10025868_42370 [Angustibacter aerolatus]|uniref:Pirin C-terminal domain-containing protein n=1 Tax=Angustibacter aerolatus TaxID=1162965 RepID=A0ABQ6JMH4_9ACTN|nr:hypothetical protein GCM10025868_42370 [Angustibacter aerolatus]